MLLLTSNNTYSYCINLDFNSDNIIDNANFMTYLKMFNSGLRDADTDESVTQGDTINAGETKHMKLFFEYKDTATELPKNNLTLTSKNPITIT